MGETLVIGLLLLLPLAIAGGGPFLLRPMSQGPKTKFLANFALIDVAALVWLLSLVPLLLRGTYTVLSIFASAVKLFATREIEDNYWFMATGNQRGPLMLALLIGLILVAIWAAGVRQLGAHGIRNWKARASYLGIAVPLAYLCPTWFCVSLALLPLDRQLRGFWGVLLILLSLLVGALSRTICVLVMRTSAVKQSAPEAAAADVPKDPFSEK
jgi:hypothetical protein